jgi:excisionase family DNA binding protein
MEAALTVDEVAKILQVHPNTIYNAIKSKRLKSFRVGEGRGAVHRIWPKDLKKFSEEADHPTPPDPEPTPRLEVVSK